MTRATRLLALLAAVALTGCGDKKPDDKKPDVKQPEPKKPDDKKPDDKKTDEHEHGEGPNGGVIFDLGKYHAEFTVNHDKKECTVLFIKGIDKTATPLPVAGKELTLTTKETKTKEGKVVPPLTIKLVPKDEKDGKAAAYVGTDPGLANVADFAGTVAGEVGGKPSSGEFKE